MRILRHPDPLIQETRLADTGEDTCATGETLLPQPRSLVIQISKNGLLSITPAAVPPVPLYPSDLFPKGHTMGSYRRDRHTASRNSAGSTTERAPLAALRRVEALPDPAPRCGENSRPGKVRHRLEDSSEAILWFHHTRVSSDFDRVL